LRKQKLLRDAVRGTGLDLRLHDSAGSWIEGVLARGDRSLGDVIERAYHGGARFDSWEEHLRLDAWQKALEDSGIDPTRFLGTLPTESRLPWDHMNVGLTEGFLAREYRRAVRNRLSPPCGKPAKSFLHHTNVAEHEADQRKLVCYHCGVACDLGAMREERADFLRSLGALVPTESLTARVPATRGPDEARPRRRYQEPPKRAAQGERVRVRLRYEKTGRAAFGSHLDQVRLLPRLFRRLDLPLYYSQGFRTRPLLTFGPALSLGMPSLGEYLDVALVAGRDLDTATLPARLSEASIEGLRFTEACVLTDADPKLGRVIDEATYVVGLPRGALDALGCADTAALDALVRARRAGADLRVRREVDGVGRMVDVGKCLVQVDVGAGADALARAGIVGALVPIQVRLRVANDGSARPGEALEALTGHADLPARIVRVALSCTRGGRRAAPTDLSAVRLAFAAPQASAAPPPAP